eukprot:g8640.t1
MATSAPVKTQYYKHGLISLTENTTMEKCLLGLSDFKQQPFTPSPFVKPISVSFKQNNKDKTLERRWDLIESHDSIAVALYHRSMNCLILVRQFRPAVYARILRQAEENGQPVPPFNVGFTYELCAGLVDKNKSLLEIAREEIMEECGFNVPLESIKKVTSYLSAIGTAGTEQTLFFAEVGDEMKTENGGGGSDNEGEAIEVLGLPIESIDSFMFDTSLPKSTGMLFAYQWIKDKLKNNAL